MKKTLFCMLCLVGLTVSITAKEESTYQEVLYKNAKEKEAIPVSHWSLGIRTGVNYYMIPPLAPASADKFKVMVGGVLDYTINPYFGFGLEYDYNDYSRPYEFNNTNGQLNGISNELLLNGSVNLSNTLAPFRTDFWKYVNIYGELGGGMAFYRSSLNQDPKQNKNTPMVKLGLNAELTLSEKLNLCFSGQYNQYDTRLMGACIDIKNNEAMIYTVGLRYKLGSSLKKHARNISLCEYTPKQVPVVVKNNYVKGESQETLLKLKDIEKDNETLRLKIQKLEKDAIEAKNVVIQKKMAKTNLTLQEKLQKMEDDMKNLEAQKEGVVNLSLDNIEFKTGSSVLAASSYATLSQVAGILVNNSFWSTLKVSGHTDNVGSELSNQLLSESRALSVKKYLESKGVPANKIVAIGWGETKPIASNAKPEGRQKNRRVEFEVK